MVIDLAPVIVFVYNRPDHFRRTIDALRNNPEASQTDLIIYSDGPKNDEDRQFVKMVRSVASEIVGFKTVEIRERIKNMGLANSIISGVSEQLKGNNSVIVLEDDMVASRNFLKFMNSNLKLYEQEESVASIHAYCYPIENLPELFFIRGADCWGWATWRRAWDGFEMDGSKLLKELVQRKLKFKFNLMGSYNYTGMLKRQIAGVNDSWAIRWHASMFLQNKLTLYPGRSLIQNIGNDGSGTHFLQSDTSFNTFFDDKELSLAKIPIKVSKIATMSFVRFFVIRKATMILRKIIK